MARHKIKHNIHKKASGKTTQNVNITVRHKRGCLGCGGCLVGVLSSVLAFAAMIAMIISVFM